MDGGTFNCIKGKAEIVIFIETYLPACEGSLTVFSPVPFHVQPGHGISSCSVPV